MRFKEIFFNFEIKILKHIEITEEIVTQTHTHTQGTWSYTIYVQYAINMFKVQFLMLARPVCGLLN